MTSKWLSSQGGPIKGHLHVANQKKSCFIDNLTFTKNDDIEEPLSNDEALETIYSGKYSQKY